MDNEKLILEYLEGTLDLKSKEEFLGRLKNDTELKKEFFEWKMIWEIGKQNELSEKSDTNKQWAKLENKLNTQFKKSVNAHRLITFLKYAAVLVVGLGLSLGIVKFENKNSDLSLNKIYVPKGQKSKVTLSDGTIIWLNSETKLTYPTQFEKNNNRNVYLEGEAYFEVTKNKKSPFIVNTEKINVKVLGTSFNVKSYPNDKTIETTLIEGKVSIWKLHENPSRETIDLIPNQKAVFNKENKSLSVENLKIESDSKQELKTIPTVESYANSKSVVSWKEDVLVFDNESLKDIAVKLERWYGYSIEIKNTELLDYRYMGKFENLESINQVLDVISLCTPIKYKINGRKVIINKKR